MLCLDDKYLVVMFEISLCLLFEALVHSVFYIIQFNNITVNEAFKSLMFLYF